MRVGMVEHCPIEMLMCPSNTMRQVDDVMERIPAVVTPAVALERHEQSPSGSNATALIYGAQALHLPECSGRIPRAFHSAWLLQLLQKVPQHAEESLHRCSDLARNYVPMPYLTITRKSALRWHVTWQGISWPQTPATSLELVLTDL
jgi:hypothetical protein